MIRRIYFNTYYPQVWDDDPFERTEIQRVIEGRNVTTAIKESFDNKIGKEKKEILQVKDCSGWKMKFSYL